MAQWVKALAALRGSIPGTHMVTNHPELLSQGIWHPILAFMCIACGCAQTQAGKTLMHIYFLKNYSKIRKQYPRIKNKSSLFQIVISTLFLLKKKKKKLSSLNKITN